MTNKYNSVSVVMPMYNEKECMSLTIEVIINFFNSSLLDYELIIVDDGSTDGSAKMLDILCQKYLRLRAIHFKNNKGIGRALREGFKSAQNDIIFYIDADLPIDILCFSKAFDLLNEGNIDIVVGYRTGKRESFMRNICTFIYNLIIQSIFKLNLKDINCAMKVFKREIIKDIKLHSDGPFIDAELMAQIMGKGGRVIEMDTNFVPQKTRISKFASPSKILITIALMIKELIECYPHLKSLRPQNEKINH